MHATDDNKPAPRPSKKPVEVSAEERERQKRIEIAVAGERCWRCFFVKCGCPPGEGAQLGNSVGAILAHQGPDV